MAASLSRRTLLAGLAALPALALMSCEYDRTTARPISTTNTLDFANRLLGYTVIVQRDKTNTANGKVMELDAAGKLRWEVKNLQTPVDAQVLPGVRLLGSGSVAKMRPNHQGLASPAT